MPNHLIDLTGKRFGRLTVIRRVENNNYGAAMWLCVCDCGKETIKTGYCLREGHVKSCGCLLREVNSKIHMKHGDTKNKLFRRWLCIRNRCKPSDKFHRKNYYDKGICVCDEWENDYSAFKEWAIANGYSPELTIDRIDGSKGYSPDNCRWIPAKDQHRNVSSNKIVEYNGEKMPIVALAEKTGIREDLLRDRLRKGWSVERAINTPLITTHGRTKYESIYRD